MTSFKNSSAALLFLLPITGSLAAQTVTPPTSAELSAIEESLETSPLSQSEQPEPFVEYTLSPQLDARSASATVRVDRFIVDPFTGYAEDELLRLAGAPASGVDISLSEIYALTDRITSILWNDGYLGSDAWIPVQEVTNGEVRIAIIVAKATNTVVTADDERGSVRSALSQLSPDQPFSVEPLRRRNLILADRLPQVPNPNTGRVGRQSVFSVTPRAEGAQEGDTTVVGTFTGTDITPKYTATINNRGTESVGPWQLDLSGEWYSSVQPYDIFRARLVRALDGEEFTFGSLGYDWLVGDNGGALSLSLSASRSAPGDDLLEAVDENSESQSISIGYSYPLILETEKKTVASLSFDARNSQSSQLSEIATEDRLRVLRLSLVHDQTWLSPQSGNLGGASSIFASGTISRGVDGLGSTSNGNPLGTRVDGDSAFNKLEVFTRYQTSLAQNTRLTVSAKGQLSDRALFSAEECGVGGARFGRAYDGSEIRGDGCIAASVQVSHSFSIDASDLVSGLGAFSFIDAGKVWNRGEAADDELASVGFGTQVFFQNDLSLALELVQPLGREVDQFQNKDPRAFLSISKRF